MSPKAVRIACTGSGTAALAELREFQGDLKRLDRAALDKLKRNILRQGFSAPIFVWGRNGVRHILDGHQRRLALLELEAEGWAVPPLPIVEVAASDKREAKRKLLQIASQFGKVTGNRIELFLDDAGLELTDVIDSISFQGISLDALSSIDEGDLDTVETEHSCPRCGYAF